MHIRPDAGKAVPKDTKEMLSIGEKDGKAHVSINNSSLSLLLECPRKSMYTLHKGIQSKTQSPATLFGTAIHKALEVFYQGKLEERKLPINFESKMEDMEFDYMDEQENLCLKAAKAFVESMSDLRELEYYDKRSIASGLWTLTHYFKTYIDDPYVVYFDDDGPVTERIVRFNMHEDDELSIDFFGQIDVILQHSGTGQLFVTDHKTTSVIGAQFLNKIKPNHQYTGYIMGAQKVLGLDTHSAMVNCIQVKSKPKTKRGGPPQMPRQITTRDQSDFNELTKTVVTMTKQYLSWLKHGFFPMGNADVCSKYNGCQFLDVCRSPEDIRENIIDAKYEVR